MISVRRLEVFRWALLTATGALAASCASTPPQVQSWTQQAPTPAGPAASQAATTSPRVGTAMPTAYSENQTPMSDVRLVESAEFATTALQHGFTPEVRKGAVVYCWIDDNIGSRIPTKKCMDKAQLEITLRQRQAQRDAIEHGHTFGCQPGINCANNTGLGRQ